MTCLAQDTLVVFSRARQKLAWNEVSPLNDARFEELNAMLDGLLAEGAV